MYHIFLFVGELFIPELSNDYKIVIFFETSILSIKIFITTTNFLGNRDNIWSLFLTVPEDSVGQTLPQYPQFYLTCEEC